MISQGSAEWFQMRAGKITASRIADVMAKGKGSAESVTRAKYRAQVVAERLTGVSQDDDGYESDAMRRGTEKEPFARAAYEAEHNVLVDQIAFAQHISIANAGCSPDGIVGEGGCEIKCPNTSTHIRWIIGGEVPPEHVKQMHWCMAVTGAQWWDFVSFDDRVPEDLRVWVRRLKRDQPTIDAMEAAVREFDAECDALVAILRHEKTEAA